MKDTGSHNARQNALAGHLAPPKCPAPAAGNPGQANRLRALFARLAEALGRDGVNAAYIDAFQAELDRVFPE